MRVRVPPPALLPSAISSEGEKNGGGHEGSPSPEEMDLLEPAWPHAVAFCLLIVILGQSPPATTNYCGSRSAIGLAALSTSCSSMTLPSGSRP